MKQFIFIVLILIAFSCKQNQPENQSFQVNYNGALKNIMHKGDLSAKVKLSKFENTKHLFALGAIENLKGEIQIFDGHAYNTSVQNDTILFDSTYSKNATLFVSSIVENWANFQIPTTIKTKKELERYIEQVAVKNKIDTNQPFPFLMKGQAESIHWHVINWKDGDTEHSHQKHIESGLHGILKQQQVELLGFYSDAHHAIFTHHTTNMHIHMKTIDGKIAGHVDDITLGKGMILKLPKVE